MSLTVQRAVGMGEALLEMLATWRHVLSLEMPDPSTFYEDDDELFSRIPKHWRSFFEVTDEQTIVETIHGRALPKHIPTDLSQWLSDICSNTLERNPAPSPCDPLLSNRDKQGMNLKKQHEIEVMVRHVPTLANQLQCTKIVDVGAGLCKLSIALTHVFKHEVIAVDQSHLKAGKERAAKLAPDDAQLQLVNRTIDDWSSLAFGRARCLLVGLHSCGSLGSRMIRSFAREESIRGLYLVSCCWHHLGNRWSPMSQFFKNSDPNIDRRSLILSCHALEKDVQLGCHRMNAFRSLLHKLLVHVGVDKSMLAEIRTGSVRGAAVRKSFAAYTQRIGPKLKGPVRMEVIEAGDPQIWCEKGDDCILVRVSVCFLHLFEKMHYAETHRKTMCIWSLRYAFAPVLESLFILDRALFLLEAGAKVQVKAVFDPKISPRCIVIQATK